MYVRTGAGSVEVFEMDGEELSEWVLTEDSVWREMFDEDTANVREKDASVVGDWVRDHVGHWYWYCFPGCLPDEPFGPFESEEAALAAIDEEVSA